MYITLLPLLFIGRFHAFRSHSGDPTSTRSQQQLVRQCLTQDRRQGTHRRRCHLRQQNTPPQSVYPTTTPTCPRHGSAAVMKSLTKFNWALSKLPFSLIDSIGPLCKNPAIYADPYQELQVILLRSYSLSTSQRTSKWLDHPGCGNNKPTVLWDQLNTLHPATVKEIQTFFFSASCSATSET
jgi:hypothetical protein